MKKKIGIFLGSASSDYQKKVLKSFAAGIEEVENLDEWEIFRTNDSEYKQCDVAVFLGSWKDSYKSHHVLKNTIAVHHKKQRLKFVVLETPLLGRKIEDEYQYWRVGVNGYLNKTGFFNNKNMEETRWRHMNKILKINVKPWRTDGEHVIVPLQIPSDASMGTEDVCRWAFKTVYNLRQHTSRPIWIKPHPIPRNLDWELFAIMKETFADIRFLHYDEMTNEQVFANAWATVTYTSGFGIDSILNGVPVIATSDESMAWPIACHDISQIETVSNDKRQQWLQNLAYTQWNLDEMRRGLPWKHLRSLLTRDLTIIKDREEEENINDKINRFL